MTIARRMLCCLLVLVASCERQVATPVRLTLVPPPSQSGSMESTLAAEGLGALLLARLRAIPGASVRIDEAGCSSADGATHALSINHEDTGQSALITLRLRDCRSEVEHHETLVQPRRARREWSGEAAFWVARQLRVPVSVPVPGAAVDETVMTSFLGAVAKLQRRTRDDVSSARRDLDEIVSQHPDFALGQAELAAAQLLSYEYGLASRADAFAAAERASSAALRIDPDLGLAHAVRGLSLMLESRYREATPVFARATALDPGNATILLWMGNALLYSGHPQEAVPWFDRAIEMEPRLASARVSRAEADCYGGQSNRCTAFLDASSDAAMGGFMRSLLRAHRGEFSLVRRSLQDEARQINEVWVLELKADVCAVLDDQACVDETLDLMQAGYGTEPETTRTRMRLRGDAIGNPADRAQPSDDDPQIDLWQIDLGLDAWMLAPNRREGLDVELDAWRDAGLMLPVLEVARACLMSLRGDIAGATAVRAELGKRAYRRDDLWQRWQCARHD